MNIEDELKQLHWLPVNIKGLENLYTVSEYGHLYSVRKGKLMRPNKISYYLLYYQYFLISDDKTIKGWFKAHRIVCQTFNGLPNYKGLEVNHIDGNKENNHYTNLEWVTHSENILKSYATGQRVSKAGEWRTGTVTSLETRLKQATAKHKPVEVLKDGVLIHLFDSIQTASNSLNINRSTIYQCIKNNRSSKGLTFRTT